MSDTYTTEFDEADDEDQPASSSPVPQGTKNYTTPAGFRRLQDELDHLWRTERPALVQTITWAASNGDRSENGDYIYGKKRLREIDKRLFQAIEIAAVGAHVIGIDVGDHRHERR